MNTEGPATDHVEEEGTRMMNRSYDASFSTEPRRAGVFCQTSVSTGEHAVLREAHEPKFEEQTIEHGVFSQTGRQQITGTKHQMTF